MLLTDMAARGAGLHATNDHEPSDRCSYAQAMIAGTRKRALPAEHAWWPSAPTHVHAVRARSAPTRDVHARAHRAHTAIRGRHSKNAQ